MKLKYILLMLTGVVFFSPCRAQQVEFKQMPSGVLYHIFGGSDTAKIKLTDVITFNVIQKTEKDSVLFSTYTSNPIKIQVQPSQGIGDLMYIFTMMAAADSAVVKVPADSVFKGHEDKRPPFLAKQSYLVFNIKMNKVQSLSSAIAERDSVNAQRNIAIAKLKTSETTDIQAYIKKKQLVVKTTLSGLKYAITKPSLKPKPLNGDTVFVNYTGRTLDGHVFDSSIAVVAAAFNLQQPGRTYEPIKVALGKGEVIKGWDEGLLLLNEGSKATFIIPSALAYGQQGAGNDIGPYTPLSFDLEVVKVKRIHHAPIKYPVKKAANPTTVKTPAKPVK